MSELWRKSITSETTYHVSAEDIRSALVPERGRFRVDAEWYVLKAHWLTRLVRWVIQTRTVASNLTELQAEAVMTALKSPERTVHYDVYSEDNQEDS